MLKKILKAVSSRAFYLILGLFLALGIFAAQAAWNSYVSGGQTLTATSWNEIVAKLVELDARPSGGASINYGDCVTMSHTEGGACGAPAWGTCPNSYVMIGATTGLRYPNACVVAQVRCCRLQ